MKPGKLMDERIKELRDFNYSRKELCNHTGGIKWLYEKLEKCSCWTCIYLKKRKDVFCGKHNWDKDDNLVIEKMFCLEWEERND